MLFLTCELSKTNSFKLIQYSFLFCFSSSRPVRFGTTTPDNKENTRPYIIREDSNDSDQSDGPILYRDDDHGNDRHQTTVKVARKESLSLKLALRPNMDELINRNILHMQSENERQESKEAIGAKLIRRLSMRPTAEELIERNILKSNLIRLIFFFCTSFLTTIFDYRCSPIAG